MRWFHGAAERTLVPTPGVKSELESKGFNPEKLIVWTRGVDCDLFHPRPKRLFEPFSDLPRPIFLYCGRVAREKNIGAFLEMQVDGSKVVVGDGPERGALERRYRGTRFVGYKYGKELAEQFAGADVFVFPSRTDTFGIVMLEAMACGLPVAAFPVTGPIDVVRDGITGILGDDLAEAATRALLIEPSACRDQALEFSWERCAGIMLENLASCARASEVERRPDHDMIPQPTD